MKNIDVAVREIEFDIFKKYIKMSDSEIASKYIEYAKSCEIKSFDVEHYGGSLGIFLADEIELRKKNKTLRRWLTEATLSKGEKKAYEFYNIMNQRSLTPYYSKLSSLRNLIREVYGYSKLWEGSNQTEEGTKGYKKNLENLNPDYLRGFVKNKYNQGIEIARAFKEIPNK